MDPKKKMPKRIENDGLVNAMVVLTYSSNYNSEYIEGLILSGLNDKFNASFQKIMMPHPIEADGEKIDHFIANRDFRIQVTKTMININIVKEYSGWENYLNLLVTIFNKLGENVVYHVAQVRYLSLYEDISIFEELDGNFHFSYIPVFYGTQLNFRCNAEAYGMSCVVTVKITDKLQLGDKVQSLVEIWAETNMVNADMNTTFKALDFLHFNEKRMFFTLLKDDFVEKHNPIYE